MDIITATKEKLVARYVSKGGNPATGARLLDEAIQSHDGDNLAHALAYLNFATERAAEKAAAILAH